MEKKKKKNQNGVLTAEVFRFPPFSKRFNSETKIPTPAHHHHRTKFQTHISNSLFFTASNTQIQNPINFQNPKNLEPKPKTHFSNPPKTHLPFTHSLNKQKLTPICLKIWIFYFHGNPKTQLCTFGFHHSRRNLWCVFTIERNSWWVFTVFAFWNPRWPFFGPYTLNSKWVFSSWPIYGCSAIKFNWVFLNFASHQWNPKWVFFSFFGYWNRNPRWLSQLPSLLWRRRRCPWGRRRTIALFPKSLIG